ncbi:MAG: 3-deoxy-D-manno-octulosonic acid transferase, partial [Saprospiraceae bacterium]
MHQFAIFIYRIIIQVYGLGIRLAAIFSPKAKLWVAGRKNIFTELTDAFQNEKAPVIWMHCASLGEFEQGKPLIEHLKQDYPHYKILLTFFSPSGYEIRKDYPLADYVFYLPLDTPSNANQFLDIVRPKLVFFIKYEFWYFYLSALQKRRIKHYLIAGIFRKSQFFFKKYAKWYLTVIQGFDYLFLQEEHSKELLAQHQIEHCEVVGDTRIDRVLGIAIEASPIPLIKQFKGERKLLMIGSA